MKVSKLNAQISPTLKGRIILAALSVLCKIGLTFDYLGIDTDFIIDPLTNALGRSFGGCFTAKDGRNGR